MTTGHARTHTDVSCVSRFWTTATKTINTRTPPQMSQSLGDSDLVYGTVSQREEENSTPEQKRKGNKLCCTATNVMPVIVRVCVCVCQSTCEQPVNQPPIEPAAHGTELW